MMRPAAELVPGLAIAVVKIARLRRSALLDPPDLRDLVARHCDNEYKPDWSACSAPEVVGLLRNEGWEKVDLGWWGGPVENSARKVGELRRLIEAEGVMFWEAGSSPVGDFTDRGGSSDSGGFSVGADEGWRIVDTTWLSSHRDIWEWLYKQWMGGRRCRFCAMAENPVAHELKQYEGTPATPGRFNGNLVHERCKPHFTDWIAIASKYSSRQEAAAADKAAGRVSRYQKVVQASALEAPA